jgi:hypothetical protein
MMRSIGTFADSRLLAGVCRARESGVKRDKQFKIKEVKARTEVTLIVVIKDEDSQNV